MDDCEEGITAEMETLLEGWTEALRRAFPRYQWERDEDRVIGNREIGEGLFVHVALGQGTDEDGDPEWLEAEASVGFASGFRQDGVIPERAEEGLRGLDPRDPVRAVRVAVRKLTEATEGHGLLVPQEGPSLVA